MTKYAKAMGLAVVAALAVMALVGATSASAKICSTSGTGLTCGGSHGKAMTVGDVIEASVIGEARLTSGFINVTCGESKIVGKITSTPEGASVGGQLTSVTFNDCHSNANTTTNSCTASTSASTANPWSVTATTSAAPNGNMSVGTVTGTFTCNAGFLGTPTCRYHAASVPKEKLVITGSDTEPIIHAEGVSLTKEEVSSFGCSSTATWEATYKVTKPTSLFMT
jgi:hypothetical protein